MECVRIKSKVQKKLNWCMYRQLCSGTYEYCFHTDTQLPVTVRPLGITEPFRWDTKWLDDTHGGWAVALPASGWDTFLWLDRWNNAVSYSTHSNARNEYKLFDVERVIRFRRGLWRQTYAWPAKPFACVRLGHQWLIPTVDYVTAAWLNNELSKPLVNNPVGTMTMSRW